MSNQKYVYKIVSFYNPDKMKGRSVIITKGPFRLNYQIGVETKAIPGTEGIACFVSLDHASKAQIDLKGDYAAIMKCRFTGKPHVPDQHRWKLFMKLVESSSRREAKALINSDSEEMRIFPKTICVDSVTPVETCKVIPLRGAK